jgi:hypothetical protein
MDIVPHPIREMRASFSLFVFLLFFGGLWGAMGGIPPLFKKVTKTKVHQIANPQSNLFLFFIFFLCQKKGGLWGESPHFNDI